jgi:hypothetical protein
MDTGWRTGKASSLRSAYDPESACRDCGGDPHVHGVNVGRNQKLPEKRP